MKLTYLYHSGFLLEFKHCYVVCDYFLDGYAMSCASFNKGGLVRAIGSLGSDSLVQQDDIEKFESLEVSPPDTSSTGVLGSLIINLDKPCYLLASHFHKDHFLPFILTIFSYAQERRSQDPNYPEVKLILSSDIKRYRRKYCAPYLEHITFIGKGESYQDHLIKINAYGSTDVGSSFALHVLDDKCSVFHAGDLNYWHWQEESTQEEIKQAHDLFLSELKVISSQEQHFDVVLFPIDPRMQTNIAAGAQEFFEHINYNLLVPMHVIEKPNIVWHELKHNDLFKTWQINYSLDGHMRISNINLLSSKSIIWLPYNSGDSALVSLF